MAYKAVHHVNFNKKLYEPGTTIPFGEDDASTVAELKAAGAISGSGKADKAAPAKEDDA